MYVLKQYITKNLYWIVCGFAQTETACITFLWKASTFVRKKSTFVRKASIFLRKSSEFSTETPHIYTETLCY